ncbi:hypothetical protein BDR07DRAFT_1381591 [Suillus spraguei]|nr:hypothetical protein BDR07DRAFT_1381591 [Suillus spraguei]
MVAALAEPNEFYRTGLLVRVVTGGIILVGHVLVYVERKVTTYLRTWVQMDEEREIHPAAPMYHKVHVPSRGAPDHASVYLERKDTSSSRGWAYPVHVDSPVHSKAASHLKYDHQM